MPPVTCAASAAVLGRVVLLGVLTLWASSAAAADADDDWEFRPTLYVWGLGLDGDLEVRGNTADIDVGFDDILENLNLAFMGHFEAQKGKLTLFADTNYSKLEDESRVGPVKLTNEVELLIQEFGAAWEVYRRNTGRALRIEVLGGGRYWYIKPEVDLGPFSAEKSKDWVDPFVGARVALGLTDRWTLALRGDVGGFGIGSAADFAWQMRAIVAYRVAERWRLLAGYGVLDLDYDGRQIDTDLRMLGPIVGAEFSF